MKLFTKMISKFNGKRKGCSKPYAEGDDIYWSKEDGPWHWECWENPAPSPEAHALAERLGFK